MLSRIVTLCGMAALAAALAGCGDNLGDACESDSDCGGDLACLSPGCIGDLSCQYPCSSDDECADKAGDGSTCSTEDPFDSCVGFCSAAD